MNEARSSFEPVSQEQVDAARADLKKQMRESSAFVKPSTTNGKRWLRYLKWDALEAHIDKQDPSALEAIDDTLSKVNRNVNGVENRRFRVLAKAPAALSRYARDFARRKARRTF